MDIKSRRYNQSRAWSILTFILCVAFFIGTLTTGAIALESASGLHGTGLDTQDVLYSSSYKESMGFQWEFEEKTSEILYLIADLKSEENIKSGQTLSQNYVESRIESLFYNALWNHDRGDANEEFHEKYGESYDDPSARELFKADYADEIEKIKEELIMDELRNFVRAKERLDRAEGFLYYATDGVNTVTNLKNMTADAPLDSSRFTGMTEKGEYLIFENDKMIKTSSSAEATNQHIRDQDIYLEEHFRNQYNPELKVYFAFEESYLADKEKAFQESKEEVLKWIPIAAICALLTTIAFIYLIVMTGRKDPEGNRPFYRIDRIFTELQLLIIAGCLFGGGYLFGVNLFDSMNYHPYHFGSITSLNTAMLVQLGPAVLVGLAFASAGLLFILSCVRNLKAGRFMKNSLVYRILGGICSGIRSVYRGGSVMRRVVLIALAVCILSATVFMAPVVFILILVLAPRWVRKYEEIRKGVNEVKNGNLTYKISVSGEGELDKLAADINEISAASSIAIQNELKNQRLKTDLISNVSHDLKTPLTSIITYIDLLKTEGLDSENAEQYLEVLDQKSMRLKKLTEDLFDAAKASSGAIPVRLETVDLLSLINQGLGEMAAGIEASGLDFIINAKQEKYYVRADGQLLWRVVENLLWNVLKYALPGSRVYIDLRESAGINGKDAQVFLEIKNISKTGLNINAEELMERFTRGDESRTTEGSGLGLAIAKDLVVLQNGWFEIKIDGDLFKAVVMLPQIRTEEQSLQTADSEE